MKINLKENQTILVVRATDLTTLSGVPSEIMIAPFGEWKGYTSSDGSPIEFEITKELAAKAVEYHKQLKLRFPTRDLVIDYEHQTSLDVQAPAAGWLQSDIFLKEDGLYARVKEWTKKATDYLVNKEYRYLSPTLLFNDVDKETNERIPLRIKNVSLTNEPFLDNIKPITAKDDTAATIIYLTDSISQQTKGDTTMLEQILQLLGLAAGATFDDVKKVIEGWKNSASTVAAKYTAAMTELGLKEDASDADVKAFALKHTSIIAELGVKAESTLEEIKTVIAKAKGSQQVDLKDYIKKTEFDSLQVQLKQIQVKEVLAKHVLRGAVAPHEVDDLTNDVIGNKLELKDLDARLAKRADYSLVPLQEIDTKTVAAKDGVVDALTLEIAAKAGVSAEDVKKFGK
ncbi:MAG: phage protease [Bacteroidota bacterium]|nr:phage protease [Bacteroidota bacterium]